MKKIIQMMLSVLLGLTCIMTTFSSDVYAEGEVDSEQYTEMKIWYANYDDAIFKNVRLLYDNESNGEYSLLQYEVDESYLVDAVRYTVIGDYSSKIASDTVYTSDGNIVVDLTAFNATTEVELMLTVERGGYKYTTSKLKVGDVLERGSLIYLDEEEYETVEIAWEFNNYSYTTTLNQYNRYTEIYNDGMKVANIQTDETKKVITITAADYVDPAVMFDSVVFPSVTMRLGQEYYSFTDVYDSEGNRFGRLSECVFTSFNESVVQVVDNGYLRGVGLGCAAIQVEFRGKTKLFNVNVYTRIDDVVEEEILEEDENESILDQVGYSTVLRSGKLYSWAVSEEAVKLSDQKVKKFVSSFVYGNKGRDDLVDQLFVLNENDSLSGWQYHNDTNSYTDDLIAEHIIDYAGDGLGYVVYITSDHVAHIGAYLDYGQFDSEELFDHAQSVVGVRFEADCGVFFVTMDDGSCKRVSTVGRWNDDTARLETFDYQVDDLSVNAVDQKRTYNQKADGSYGYIYRYLTADGKLYEDNVSQNLVTTDVTSLEYKGYLKNNYEFYSDSDELRAYNVLEKSDIVQTSILGSVVRTTTRKVIDISNETELMTDVTQMSNRYMLKADGSLYYIRGTGTWQDDQYVISYYTTLVMNDVVHIEKASQYSDQTLVQRTNGTIYLLDRYYAADPKRVYTYFPESEDPVVENPFTDVDENEYYYDPMMWAVEKGITAGTSPTTFSPEAECTRAQVATFLWRAAGQPEPKSTTNPFTDVTDSGQMKPFYKAILWAYESGITSGTSKTLFSPNATCTRAQIVTFLYRYAGKPAVTTTSNPFTDVHNSGSMKPFYEPIMWAVENGITSGTSKTKFSPDAVCTRAQVVTFLYRLLAK